jgi:hypothetical protein
VPHELSANLVFRLRLPYARRFIEITRLADALKVACRVSVWNTLLKNRERLPGFRSLTRRMISIILISLFIIIYSAECAAPRLAPYDPRKTGRLWTLM